MSLDSDAHGPVTSARIDALEQQMRATIVSLRKLLKVHPMAYSAAEMQAQEQIELLRGELHLLEMDITEEALERKKGQ